MTPIQGGRRRAHTQATQQAEQGDTLPGTHMPIVLRTSMIPTPARTYSVIRVNKTRICLVIKSLIYIYIYIYIYSALWQSLLSFIYVYTLLSLPIVLFHNILCVCIWVCKCVYVRARVCVFCSLSVASQYMYVCMYVCMYVYIPSHLAPARGSSNSSCPRPPADQRHFCPST
jgi:hypothetical protein